MKTHVLKHAQLYDINSPCSFPHTCTRTHAGGHPQISHLQHHGASGHAPRAAWPSAYHAAPAAAAAAAGYAGGLAPAFSHCSDTECCSQGCPCRQWWWCTLERRSSRRPGRVAGVHAGCARVCTLGVLAGRQRRLRAMQGQASDQWVSGWSEQDCRACRYSFAQFLHDVRTMQTRLRRP